MPQVDERCASNQVRLSDSRACVEVEGMQESCKSLCNGDFDRSLGACACEVDDDSECDAACEANLPNLTMRRREDGKLAITLEPGVEIVLDNDLGLSDNDRATRPFITINVRSDGMSAVRFGTTDQAEEQFGGGPGRRRRQAATEPYKTTNPVVCLEYSSALLFDVEINDQNRSLSHFPRYSVNNLLNENDGFDYGRFRQLEDLVLKTNRSIKHFVHVCDNPGKFVFVDNADSLRQTVVRCMDRGQRCPEGTSVQPALTGSFSILGITMQEVRAAPLSNRTHVPVSEEAHFSSRTYRRSAKSRF